MLLSRMARFSQNFCWVFRNAVGNRSASLSKVLQPGIVHSELVDHLGYPTFLLLLRTKKLQVFVTIKCLTWVPGKGNVIEVQDLQKNSALGEGSLR